MIAITTQKNIKGGVDMDRLTLCNEYSGDIWILEKGISKELIAEDDDYYSYFKKLADYEDAEEQGLLVRLPCKEVYDNSGGDIWYIYLGEIIQCVQCSTNFGADGMLYISLAYDEKIFPYREPIAEFDTDPTDWCVNFTDVPINEVGKTLFFTREAAEHALKEMEDKNAY